MSAIEMKMGRTSYKCGRCGHSWTVRKTKASQRRCSECGSRTVIETGPEVLPADTDRAPLHDDRQGIIDVLRMMQAKMDRMAKRGEDRYGTLLSLISTTARMLDDLDARLSVLEELTSDARLDRVPSTAQACAVMATRVHGAML